MRRTELAAIQLAALAATVSAFAGGAPAAPAAPPAAATVHRGERARLALIRRIHQRIAPGHYFGLTPEGRACSLTVEEEDQAPARSKYYDPRTGLDAREIRPCSRLKAMLFGIEACLERFDPGPTRARARFDLEMINRSWVDRANLSLSSDREDVSAVTGRRRILKGAAELDGREGAHRRFLVRLSEQDGADPAVWSRRQIRGAVDPASRAPLWVELARKDSPELLRRAPRLLSEQNLIRCQGLRRH